MLQASLGVNIDALRGVVEVDDTVLPSGIERLNVTGLQVGAGAVDLAFQQMGAHTVALTRRKSDGVAVRIVG